MLKDFEKKYGVEHPALHVQRRRRGSDQDRRREPRVRPLLPELRLPGSAGPGRPAAAAQPGLPDQQRQLVGRLPRPLVRPGRAVHACRTPSTPPASAGAPTGSPRTSPGPGQPLRRLLGHASTPATWRSSTTGTPRWRWCCCATDQHDINTTDERDIALVRKQLLELRATMDPQGDHRSMYTDLPAGQYGLARCGRATRSTRRTTCPRTSRSTSALLVPLGRQGRGRQRPGGLPGPGPEPGGCALLHQRPAGRRHREAELRLHRLPAAAEAVSRRTRWSRRATSRRTSRRRPWSPKRTSRPAFPLLQLPPAADTAWHQVWQEFKAGG